MCISTVGYGWDCKGVEKSYVYKDLSTPLRSGRDRQSSFSSLLSKKDKRNYLKIYSFPKLFLKYLSAEVLRWSMVSPLILVITW